MDVLSPWMMAKATGAKPGETPLRSLRAPGNRRTSAGRRTCGPEVNSRQGRERTTSAHGLRTQTTRLARLSSDRARGTHEREVNVQWRYFVLLGVGLIGVREPAGVPLRLPSGDREPNTDSALAARPAPTAHGYEAFETFYHREYRAVVALAYALTGRTLTAEDLAQDAMLATHQRWATVSRYESPGGYVRHVVANMAVSYRRRLVVEGRAIARLRARARPSVDSLDPPDAEFWRAVRSLPRRQAQTVALYYLEDRSTEEIASILRCSNATVRVHLHRGRTALAGRLGIEEVDR
jgi:RNA polymerase sigma-70 factor, ECF subfamily